MHTFYQETWVTYRPLFAQHNVSHWLWCINCLDKLNIQTHVSCRAKYIREFLHYRTFLFNKDAFPSQDFSLYIFFVKICECHVLLFGVEHFLWWSKLFNLMYMQCVLRVILINIMIWISKRLKKKNENKLTWRLVVK